jgi:hypothetical protein
MSSGSGEDRGLTGAVKDLGKHFPEHEISNAVDALITLSKNPSSSSHVEHSKKVRMQVEEVDALVQRAKNISSFLESQEFKGTQKGQTLDEDRALFLSDVEKELNEIKILLGL